MALCTTLQNRVLDLEKTKTTQHNEIASLKRRVKKIKKKDRSRTHRLKRLYKVGLTARVESSDNEEKMFDVNVLDGKEVFVAEQEVAANKENDKVNVVEEVVEVINTAKLITDAAQVSATGNVVSTVGDATTISAATTTTATITTVDDITLAQAHMEIKSKDWMLIINWLKDATQEQEELSIEEKATLFQQLLDKRRNHFATKGAEEKRNKPPTKAQQIKIMCTYLKNMEGYKLKDLKLKEFDSIQEMQDLEDLYKLVKAKYESTRPVEDLDLLLWGDLKTMFEPHVEDKVWRNQQEYKVLD
ncbi:hypothetical protein Tco_1359998 [Tanacetum coccineum]